MNDIRAWNNVEVLGPDRTYDLGEGITVKVARVNPIQRNLTPPLQDKKLPQNQSSKLPVNFGRCLGRQHSKLSLSPAPSNKNGSLPRKSPAYNPIEKKESARVQIKRAASPKTQTIVDFSVSGRNNGRSRANLIPLIGKENFVAASIPQQKYPRTSREKAGTSKTINKNKLRQKSECQIPNLMANQSIVSDLIDSGPRAIPVWNNYPTVPNEGTAQFGSLTSPTQINPEKLIQDLTLQWQDMAIRSESLEVALFLQKRKVDEYAKKEMELILEAWKTEEKRLTKALFLINKLFSAELDEESQVRCAQVIESLQSSIELVKTTYINIESKISGQAPANTSCLALLENLQVWGDVVDLTTFMNKALEKKKSIENTLFQTSSWFAEIQYTSETVHDLSLRDHKTMQELLHRIEDMETLMTDEQRTASSVMLDSSLRNRDIQADSQLVYEAQAAKVFSEGFERLTTTIKNTKVTLIASAKLISEQAREIDDVDKEKVIDDLDMLVSEKTSNLLAFVLLLEKFSEGFDLQLETRTFSIDCIKLLGGMIQQLVPSLSSLYDTVISSLFDGSTFGSIQIVQPLLEDILRFTLMTVSTSLMADISTLLHRPDPVKPSEAALRAVGHLATSLEDLLYESFEAGELGKKYQTAVLQVASLREKQRHYYRRVQDLQAAVSRKLAIFQHSEVDVGQFAAEITKLAANRQQACSALGQEVAKAQEEARLAEKEREVLEKEFHRALEEIRVVKSLKHEQTSRCQSRDKSASRDGGRPRSPGFHRSSNTSLAKNSDTSVNKKSKEMVNYSLEEDLDDEKLEKLNDSDRKKVERLRTGLSSFQSKNVFFKKLLRLLESEFNLELHAGDWLARAVDGLVVRKGPKLACGYTGPKKVDGLEAWKHLSSGKPLDLDKLGFGHRLLKFDTLLKAFVIFRPHKKPTKMNKWEASPAELLQDYTVVIEESTKKTLWEQLGKPDGHAGFLSQLERNALKSCLLYTFEFKAKDSSNCFQIIIEEVRSALSFIVTLCAAGLA